MRKCRVIVRSRHYLAVNVICRSALADSKISVPSDAGGACRPPQCSHVSRVTTRSLRQFGQETRAGHSCSTSIRSHPTQPKKKPNERPADHAGTGKGIAAGQQPAANRAGRCRQHDQGEVAGNQSAWGHFKRGGTGDVIPAVLKVIREARASGCFPSGAPPSAGSAMRRQGPRPPSSA